MSEQPILLNLPALELDWWKNSPAAHSLGLDKIDRVLVFSLPLKHRFRRIIFREGLLLHGPHGWGEFAPFWDYGARESKRWLEAALAQASTSAPAPKRQNIPVNVTIPVVAPERAYELVLESGGCQTAKVKVADRGVSLADDVERVQAVRKALDESVGADKGAIRVDVNGVWHPLQALEGIKALAEAAGGLEYIEQPCSSLTEIAQVREKSDVKIALDESIRRSARPLQDVPTGLADVVVTKVAPLGGVAKLLELAAEAKSKGMDVVVSSAMDSAIGIDAGVQAAAALEELPYACGLGTSQLLASDLGVRPWRVENGCLPVQEQHLNAALIRDFDSRSRDLVARWSGRVRQILLVAAEQMAAEN